MQKKLLGLLEPQAAKCQKFLCIGSEAQEFFLHRVGNSTILAPFRPYAKKPLGILIRAKYPNKRTSDLMQKSFRQNCTFRALAKVFY